MSFNGSGSATTAEIWTELVQTGRMIFVPTGARVGQGDADAHDSRLHPAKPKPSRQIKAEPARPVPLRV